MDEPRPAVEPTSDGAEVPVERLLTTHLPGLRAYLRLRMGPELRAKESASDLVQSTCREILEHEERYRYRSPDGFRQWLFATALRKVKNRLSYYRAEKRDVGREIRTGAGADDTSLAALYQTLSTPSGRLMERERIEALEAAFDRLSPAHREVILLARVVGLSHEEVGRQTGRSTQASRALLHRALAELAERMEGSEEPS